MRKVILTAIIFLGMSEVFSVYLYCGPGVFELKTTEATLSIDNNGNLKIIQTGEKGIQIITLMNTLYRLTLKSSKDGREMEFGPDGRLKLNKSGDVFHLVQDGFTAESEYLPVRVELTISVKDDSFCFSGIFKCESEEWKIKELNYPVFSGIKFSDKDFTIYWPNSLGECFIDPAIFGSRSFDYPGTNGSMAWFSLNSANSGLYFGCHDQQRRSKTFSLNCLESDESLRIGITFPVYNNEFKIPEIIIKPYRGSWHVASKFYRTWFDQNFKLPVVSQWTKDNAGLMLTILKQQNGSLMWKYNEIDKLCDIAEKLNIKLIGLWGWGVGGHDRLYPDYTPDDLMGGRDELVKAIERAHKRGFKIIVYSNGTIMDASTGYYHKNGIETIQLSERKQPNIEFYLKHSNTTPVIQVRACPGSAIWRKTVMDLALNARSLGVDAFYIDQVGVRGPFMCFSEKHDHVLPQEAYTTFRFKMMHDIRSRMKEIDPEFSIITEGTVDALLTDVDVFHGLGPGSMITTHSFPEMFRYTFPESIIIQLNPSPALTRYDANYAAVYGLRHEIMCRYEPDADYLRYGKIPSAESYSDLFVNDPPIVKKMTQVSPEEVTSYTNMLIRFENENSRFFRNGRFIDQDGIEVNGDDILAKGFISGEQMGVVVWNKHLSEERDFLISVPGYRLLKAAEPGNHDAKAFSPLPANSVRLLSFGK